MSCRLSDREEYAKQLNLDNTVPSILLQTCNRVELYYGDGEVPDDVARHLSGLSVVWNLPSLVSELFKDR